MVRRRRHVTCRRRRQAGARRFARKLHDFTFVLILEQGVEQSAFIAKFAWRERLATVRAAGRREPRARPAALVQFIRRDRLAGSICPSVTEYFCSFFFLELGRILGPGRIGFGRHCLRRRQIAGRRNHERRALAILDRRLIRDSEHPLQELQLWQCVVVIIGCAGRNGDERQREGARATRERQPFDERIGRKNWECRKAVQRCSMIFSTNVCAAGPSQITLGRNQGAFAARLPAGIHTTGAPPRQRWPYRLS